MCEDLRTFLLPNEGAHSCDITCTSLVCHACTCNNCWHSSFTDFFTLTSNWVRGRG